MPADREGQQLGYYKLLRVLGKGGFAEVYLGEHVHLKTQAAVKVLRAQLTRDEADNFTREARTLAHLINAHIVRVLDFGFDNDTPFLVMEYAPNGTLRQIHPRGTAVPLPMIVAYVKQIAEALYYAHSKNVIHRDVKPENMLLGRQNELLLSDFGIATMTQSSQASNHQSIAGTALYMAPEQISGRARPASDQYALGVIVYEWLVGTPPFQGSFVEISTQHLMKTPPAPRTRVPTIPLLMEKVVLTALSKEPENRFGSVQAFANALENAYLDTQHPAAAGPKQAGMGPKPLPPRPLDMAGMDVAPKRTSGAQPTGSPFAQPVNQQAAQMPQQAVYASGPFFNSLPALPEAKVSELWWPTFFIELDKRKEICSGKLPQRSLGITGSIPLTTNPLVPLPVSDAYIQPTAGSLIGMQTSQHRFTSSPQPTPRNMQPTGSIGAASGPKRSTRPAGAPAPASGAGSAPSGAKGTGTSGSAGGQVQRSSSSATAAAASAAAATAASASRYAGWAMFLSILSLLIIGITFIPSAGYGARWAPVVNFTLAGSAFICGAVGANKSTPMSGAKSVAGWAIALAIIAIILELIWLGQFARTF